MISNRAQDILNNRPKNQLKEYDIHVVSDQLEGIEIFFNLNDSTYFIKTSNNLETSSFICAYFEIISKMNISKLDSLSFREVESYLRDENHRLAWDDVTGLKPWFEKCIEVVIFGFINSLLMKNVQLHNWNDLSLKEKILSLNSVLNNSCNELKPFNILDIELVAVEEDTIIIQNQRLSKEDSFSKGVIDALSSYLQFSFSSSLIKLVAQ